MSEGPDGAQPDLGAKSSGADLEAKVADLENRLEDALRLKREVETQAEIIRVLTRRADDERRRAEQMAHPLRTLRSKLIYHTKVAVYREIHSSARWRRTVEGRYRRKGAEGVPVDRSTPRASPSPSGQSGESFKVEDSPD
jgi:hypothetical protein